MNLLKELKIQQDCNKKLLLWSIKIFAKLGKRIIKSNEKCTKIILQFVHLKENLIKSRVKIIRNNLLFSESLEMPVCFDTPYCSFNRLRMLKIYEKYYCLG